MTHPHPMKPNPTRKAPALPKARVAYAAYINGYPEDIRLKLFGVEEWPMTPVAVIPTRTKAQARELIRIASFFAMTEMAQLNVLAEILSPDCGQHADEVAAAVLAAIKKGGRK